MNHSAAHRDRVAQHFVGNSNLFEGVDSTGREREIDRASPDQIAFARISPAFVKIDIVPTPPQVRAEQSAS
jgi:hypothetical protein